MFKTCIVAQVNQSYNPYALFFGSTYTLTATWKELNLMSRLVAWPPHLTLPHNMPSFALTSTFRVRH